MRMLLGGAMPLLRAWGYSWAAVAGGLATISIGLRKKLRSFLDRSHKA